jgi:NAD(P)H-nitrite reductase large subunit
MKHIIIGNGTAGVHAAEAIRALDPEAFITMIAGEAFPPYCRPMISLWLEGSVGPDALPIRSPDFYAALRIQALCGQWVTAIDPVARSVLTDRGRSVPFDRLLIASGADPRPVSAQGADLGNIFFMRTADHVRGILEALPGARSALVVGGGLVGFKAAYGLLRRGLQVTMLIGSDYPLSMQVDRRAGELIVQELIKHGLHVRVGASVVAFGGNGAVREAILADGTTLPCQLVVIGKGVTPATSFVPRERIAVDLGVLVDDHLQTSVPGIYAAGDVAEHFDVARRSRWVNAIWPVAVEQGRIAGMNMAGRPVVYRGSLSRNVIRVFGLDVLTVGMVNPPPEAGCEVLTSGDPRRCTYRKLVFRGDCLVGVVMVNDIEQGGVLTALAHQAVRIRHDHRSLLRPGFHYGQLLRP